MSALEHGFFQGLSPTLLIAHRGGALVAPENTLLAFRQAVDVHRADMLELDVHATADGVLVVAHDDDVGRCTDGHGPIARLAWAELSTLDAGHRFSRDGGFPFRGQGVRIPRFADVLDAFPHTRLNVELKPTALGQEAKLAAMIRDASARDRVCIGSESDEVAARLHDVFPDACHFYPKDALIALVFSLKSGATLPVEPRYSVLDMPLAWEGTRLVDPAFLAAAREVGKWVNVWTVDDEADMRRCIDEGVGGVMTDRPDLLRAVLDGAPRP
ncbi:MAG: glycerophosphodiester phosphodiesterase [Polyangiales bacterium]